MSRFDGQTSISSWLTARHLEARATATVQPEIVDISKADEDGEARSTSRSDACATVTGQATDQHTPYVKKQSQAKVDWESTSPLPSQAIIEPCSSQHLKAFRRLTSLLLPIPYPDSFYTETIGNPIINSLTRVVLWGQSSRWTDAAGSRDSGAVSTQLVAAIRCRLLDSVPNDPSEKIPVLYISTLGTLSPFRSHGLASQLLHSVARRALENYGAATIMAHVWEANNEALAWYKNRGFQVVGKDDMYYRRLAPQTAAYIVRNDLRPSDYAHQAFMDSNG